MIFFLSNDDKVITGSVGVEGVSFFSRRERRRERFVAVTDGGEDEGVVIVQASKVRAIVKL